MKYLFLSLLSIFVTKASHAQELEGEWNGWFKYRYDAVSIPGIYINLKFLFNKDSTYTIYSYTPFDYYIKKKQYYDTSVCLVQIERLTADSLFLEEKRSVDSNAHTPGCYQRMSMKIVLGNDQDTLSGTWESTKKGCENSGSIVFIRKKRS